MTEQEAISVLKMIETHGYLPTNAKDEAIKALEEVEQYRAIGTVSELQDIVIGINALADSQFSAADMEKLVNDMKSLYEYRQIGTPEECQAAVEKLKAKQPKQQGVFDSNGKFHTWNGINGKPYLLCPNCGTNLCCEMPYDKKPKYCDDCGQKLNWEEEDEQTD